MKKIVVGKLTCRRCDYVWVPRRKEVRVCPRCHSPYWDRDKNHEEKNKR